MNLHSEWMGEAALLRHYQEVRARLRTPPNTVPDAGINLRNGQPEPKKVPESKEPPQLPLSADQQKIAGYVHAYRTSFRRVEDTITIRSTLNLVAQEFGLTRAAIRSRGRTLTLSLPRQIAVYLTAKHTRYSMYAMAEYLGLDRSTLVYSRDKIAMIMAKGGPEAAKINDIEAKLLEAYPRAALSPFYKPAVADKPGQGSQVEGIYPVDNAS